MTCGWLQGVQVSAGPVDCAAWTPVAGPVPLLQSLASLNNTGYTTASITEARNAAHQRYITTLQTLGLAPVRMGCRSKATVRQQLLHNSSDYGRALMGSLGKPWKTNVSGVCSAESCLDHGPLVEEAGSDLVQDIITTMLGNPVPCHAGCKCTTNLSPNVCAWMQDTGPTLYGSGFDLVDLTTLSTRYTPRDDGCNTYPSCSHGAECVCVFTNLEPEELTAAVPQPLKPTTPPWVVFYASSAPTDIPDTGIARGDGWVALDACRAPEAGSRCNLGSQPTSDSCNGGSTTAESMQSMYCGPYALFQNTNPQESQCLSATCLGGDKIASRRVVVPKGVKATVFSSAPITCHRLSCAPEDANNGKVVVDPTQFTASTYTETVVRVAMFGTSLYLDLSLEMYTNGGTAFWGTTACVKATGECHLNSLRTRPLSYLYATANMGVRYNNVPKQQPTSYNRDLAASIIRATDDRFDSDTDIGRACLESSPSNIALCNYSSAFGSNSLRSVGPCADTQINMFCASRAALYCSDMSRDAKCLQYQYGNQRCILPSDYDDCVKPFVGGYKWDGVSLVWEAPRGPDYCMAFFAATCKEVVYKRTETKIPCTATEQSCPFDEKLPGQTESWEEVYSKSGLPREGFCPACSALDGSCEAVKSSSTYAALQDKIRMHTIAGTQVSTGSLTGANAVHLRLETDGAQCGLPTCGANQKPVQFLRGLWTCVDCVAAPVTQCVGNHWCRFPNNTAFPEAFASIKARIEAAVPQAAIPPVPLPWGSTYSNFSGFNPSILNSGFNTAITGLQGKCKSDQALPSFSECQNDAPRRTLRSHVKSQYTVQEGAQIPSLTTLTWTADYAQLTSTNIPAWEAARETPFLDALLDDSVCRQANFNQLVCFQKSGTVGFFNPSMAGNFEVQQGCDTVIEDSTRFVDSQCNRLVCPQNSDSYDTYNMFQGTNPASNWMQCKVIDHQIPSYYSTPSSVPTNLCSKTPPTPSVCNGRQGTLDGDGAPGDLYSTDPPPSMPSSVLDGTLGSSKNLSVSQWDIGGHYIRMQVGGQKLKVTELPLRPADLSSAPAMNATDWVKAWKKASVTERQSLLSSYPDPACGTWACPLKRWRFWTGSHPTFRPFSPDPTRTEPFYDSPTHPTTAPARLKDGVLGGYKTWDGVCAFPAGTQRPATGPCSEAEAARALADGQQRESKAYGSCGSQVDWPLVGGQLRDGATLRQNVSACGVLDRMPAFRYRYRNSRTTIPTTLTSLDEGGDCHMGRAAVADAPPPTNCTLLEKTATSMVLECNGVNRTLTRPRSPTVEEMLQSPVRSRCSGAGAYACEATPTYNTASGETLEAETSFGQLWRWAPARLLARDLRFRMCGNGTDCPQSSTWTLETFWSLMLGNTLTTDSPTTPSVNALFDEVKPDPPDPAWDQDWLLCTKNASGAMCSGKISKNDWLRGDRAQLCKAVLTQPNTKSASVGVSVCDLDDRMDSLCRAIQSARYRVFEANCQLTGKCLTSAFFYQPATYSIDDGQFVRSTVGYFYNFTEPGSCPTLDAETLKILAQNSQTSQHCAAQDLQALQFAIQRARETVHFFVKIVYYMVFIAFDIIQLVSASNPDAIVQDIMYRFNQITAEFNKFFQTMGDLAYKMMMETGKLGKALQDIVQKICGFLNDIFSSVVVPLICFVKDAVLKVIGAFQTMIGALNSFLGGALGQIDNALKSAMAEMESRLDCNMRNPFNCKGLFPDTPNGPTSLPMPTRCWVGYQPALGDQSNLGCAASDTCEDDGGLKACAACTGGGYTEAYGCDSVTKLCRYAIYLAAQSGGVRL